MTIKKYGTGGKPKVVEDDLSDEEEVEGEEEPEDDDRDDERDEPVAPES